MNTKPLPKRELVKKFTIRRRDWGRGVQHSLLFKREGGTADGKVSKCCIGFYAQACGMKSDDLNEVALVNDLITEFRENTDKEGASGRVIHTRPLPLRLRRIIESVGRTEENEQAWFKQLYQINDDPRTDDAFKEKEIIRIFASKGIKVTFVD